MGEPRRVQLTTLSSPAGPDLASPTRVLQPAPPAGHSGSPTGTVRLVLTLFEPGERNFPEFSYTELLEGQKSPGSEVPLSRFQEEELKEQQELSHIAKKLQEKYGGKPPKQTDRIQDLIDIGYGYDEEDSFIDNAEAYDEFVPSSITTKLGGFYVNAGVLQFRKVYSDTESGEGQDEHSGERKRKPSKKRKLNGSNEPQKKHCNDNSQADGESGPSSAPIGEKSPKKKTKKTSFLSVTNELKKLEKEPERQRVEKATSARGPSPDISPLALGPADAAGGGCMPFTSALLSLKGSMDLDLDFVLISDDSSDDSSSSLSLPSASTDRLSSTSSVPLAPQNRLSTTYRVPMAPKDKLSTTSSVSTAHKDKLSTTSRVPTTPKDKLSTTSRVPTAPKDELSTTSRVPTASKEELSTTYSVPTAPKDGLSTTSCVPTAPKDGLSTKSSVPTAPKDRLSTSSVPTTPKDKLSATSRVPTAPKDELSTTSRVPTAPKDELSTTSRVPTAPKDELSTTSRVPLALKDELSTTYRVPRAPKDELSTTSGVPTASTEELTHTSSVPLPCPEGFPPDVEESINKLLTAIKTSEGESKVKYYTPEINNILLQIDAQCRKHGGLLRSLVFSHICTFLPCSKKTLQQRVNRLKNSRTEEEDMEQLLKTLREAIEQTMPEQRLQRKAICKANKLSVIAAEEEQKEVAGEKSKGPKKQFQWSEVIRESLGRLLKLKLERFQREHRGQDMDQCLRLVLDSEVKPLWPKGWMSSSALLKESRKLLEHGPIKVKTSDSPPDDSTVVHPDTLPNSAPSSHSTHLLPPPQPLELLVAAVARYSERVQKWDISETAGSPPLPPPPPQSSPINFTLTPPRGPPEGAA